MQRADSYLYSVRLPGVEPASVAHRILVLFLFEHFIFALRSWIAFTVPKVPRSVRKALAAD